MNEEEKKARAFLRFYVSDIKDEYFDRDYHIDKKFAETILKLIEKQQKELEELKTITREYESYKLGEGNKIMIASKEWFNNGYFEENFINKDKIEGLIQEIESYAYTSLEEKEKQDYAIYELKRLLGGE